MKTKTYQKLAKLFPFKRFRYFLLIDEWAKATTGKYGNQNAVETTVADCLERNYPEYMINR